MEMKERFTGEGPGLGCRILEINEDIMGVEIGNMDGRIESGNLCRRNDCEGAWAHHLS
jgi:hypothetical protein